MAAAKPVLRPKPAINSALSLKPVPKPATSRSVPKSNGCTSRVPNRPKLCRSTRQARSHKAPQLANIFATPRSQNVSTPSVRQIQPTPSQSQPAKASQSLRQAGIPNHPKASHTGYQTVPKPRKASDCQPSTFSFLGLVHGPSPIQFFRECQRGRDVKVDEILKDFGSTSAHHHQKFCIGSMRGLLLAWMKLSFID